MIKVTMIMCDATHGLVDLDVYKYDLSKPEGASQEQARTSKPISITPS